MCRLDQHSLTTWKRNMKKFIGTSLCLLLIQMASTLWAHEEPMPGNGPGSEQGQKNNNRPHSQPGNKSLHTDKGRLTGGGGAALGGPFPVHNIE